MNKHTLARNYSPKIKRNPKENQQKNMNSQRNLFINIRNSEIDAIDAKCNTLLFINTHDLFVAVFSGRLFRGCQNV